MGRDHARYPQLIFMASELAVGDSGYDYFNFDHSYPIGHFYWEAPIISVNPWHGL